MKNEKVKFENTKGQALDARIEFPEGEVKSFAVFAHCFTCSKNLNAVRHISQSLNECGFAVLRFDFTGLGESEGDFSESNFSSNVSDLIAAAEYLKENHQAPKLLIGHSLGGAAVLFAAKQITEVQAVATIGAPADPEHVSHLFGSKLDEIKEDGEAVVKIGGRPFKIQQQFIEDINSRSLENCLKELDKALLIMHSPQDTTVGIENAADIYQGAMHPKSFISLDGADHLLSDKDDSIYVGKVIATWAERYVD